ncbi:UDP-N-acetylmuramate--L-alanine ligase [Sporomusa acidovorans]|uniref:UDP-N-acetylmuramate--L-alanine ligase n=1 Tax=Sporomusa acidovorans (strain ATCC 49682 / DSM 3132 / Mol) TaxID=1123286 RepID=A0ABZ3J1Y9_SPOA4|nr:UDP-N-acetylmuramate--L-alanine ligase [Sporomusa acidovorans]OZC13607.1 UDP-N-acetylmuramate--L-alanine ligase [Sporomusa acidovorans DSM 3132]SDE86933.1 UDP-N-acetylmuramate--L-alanine ligase [Sporomusa acidovorans]
MLENINRIHFVGIGGSGMSSIAKVMLEMGYVISGSDAQKSAVTAKLEQAGARVHIGHNQENIGDTQAVVVSTAIPVTNPEVAAARERGIPIYHRADMLAFLMSRQQGIAVAGAHGKTTTTSMISLILEKAGTDPTIVIGGELESIGGSAKLGQGPYLVAEADESDGSFLKLSPQIAVVTNIENDHMDYYKTMDNILRTFNEFLHKLAPADGIAVLCFDNSYIRNMAASLKRRYISYALEHEAEYTARNIHADGPVSVFDVFHQDNFLGSAKICVPGKHNVCNALAAIAVGMSAGLSFPQIAEGLAMFQGAKRRFQSKGRVNGVWVVDDYAHHPTEISTTLLGARQTNPKRLICVFQPHRYTRTSFLKKEFGSVFKQADLLILTDVYAAGEQPIPGVSGETIKNEIEQQTSQRVTYIPDKNKIARYLVEIVEPGDLVMTMGAGNIYQVGEELVEKLTQHT